MGRWEKGGSPIKWPSARVKEKSKLRTTVLDTTAFITGYNPLLFDQEQFSVPSVLDELVPDTTEWLRFKVAEESGKLKTIVPSKSSVEQVRELSADIGEIKNLSKVDTEILALALELKREDKEVIVVSDDYSIQNVCKRMGIKYSPLAKMGIRHHIRWVFYCPACLRKYPPNYSREECLACGTKLKRRPLRKERVNLSTR